MQEVSIWFFYAITLRGLSLRPSVMENMQTDRW